MAGCAPGAKPATPSRERRRERDPRPCLGSGRTASVRPGSQGRRRAAAGEAGAADFPERERTTGNDARPRARCRGPRISVLPRRLRRRRHGVRTIDRRHRSLPCSTRDRGVGSVAWPWSEGRGGAARHGAAGDDRLAGWLHSLTSAADYSIRPAMRTWASWLMLGLAVFGAGSSAQAYYLGGNRDFDLRARVYSQLGIMMDNAEKDQPTRYKIGDLAQHRNFYNPEFDARLTKYMRWTDNVPGLSLLSPDEFKFRFAWWGFYDGIYDYLDPEWNNARKAYKARFAETDNVNKDSFLFNDQNKNPRHVYASRNRINELYLDYTKGRLFTRVGRQAISWGESDDIALLDATNLFDLTLGVPGLIQDLEEARIPAWALRNTVKVFEDWGALASGFVDAYVIPGVVDTTVPIDPITAGVSPFNPDVPDPQNQIAAVGKLLHVDVVSHQPAMSWANTRWG